MIIVKRFVQCIQVINHEMESYVLLSYSYNILELDSIGADRLIP